MKTALIFSFSDIGKNARMLRYTKQLINKKNMKVVLVGYDISDIPLEIKKLPNLSIRYIFPFICKYQILQLILWPLQFIFFLIQMIGIALNISSLNLIIASSTFYFTEAFCGLLISKIHHSTLIFDISNFSWYDNQITSFITKKMLSFSNYLLCPTHSIEVVLNLAGFRPFVIPDVPDSSFQSNKQMKKQICELLKIDEDSILIGVPIPEFDNDKLKILEESANYIKKSSKSITIIIFGNGKLRDNFEEKIECISVQNVSFKFSPFQYNTYPLILGACDIGIYFPESEFVFQISPHLLAIVACGIPTVTFRFGCVNEIVKENQNGIILNEQTDLGPKLKEIFVSNSIDLSSLKSEPKSEFTQRAEILCDEAFSKILSNST